MKAGLKYKILFGNVGEKALLVILLIAGFFTILTYTLGVVNGSQSALQEFYSDKNVKSFKLKGEMNPEVFESERIGSEDSFLIPFSLANSSEQIFEDVERKTQGNVAPRQVIIWNKVSKESFRNIFLFGIIPEKEMRVSEFSVEKGRFLKDTGEAVIDEKNAGKLDVTVNDTFQIEAGLIKSEHRVEGRRLEMKVVGILNGSDLALPPNTPVRASKLNESSPFVESGIFMHLEDISNLSDLSGPTEIVVKNLDFEKSRADLEEIKKIDTRLSIEEDITSYKYLTRDFRAFLAASVILSTGLVVVVSIVSSSIISISLKEKLDDFKILKALGVKDEKIMRYFVALPLLLTVSGFVFGFITGILVSQREVVIPALFTNVGSITPAIGLQELGLLILVCAFVFVLTLFPALKLRKKFLGGDMR